jgi:hypothetical protein
VYCINQFAYTLYGVCFKEQGDPSYSHSTFWFWFCFVLFGEWNELIHCHLIPFKLTITINIIRQNLLDDS